MTTYTRESVSGTIIKKKNYFNKNSENKYEYSLLFVPCAEDMRCDIPSMYLSYNADTVAPFKNDIVIPKTAKSYFDDIPYDEEIQVNLSYIQEKMSSFRNGTPYLPVNSAWKIRIIGNQISIFDFITAA